MPAINLYPYQAKAVENMHNGCILCGGVGTGKSATSLAYVYTVELGGTIKVNGLGKWSPPKVAKDIFIITTAMKRDSGEWEDELYRFGLSTDPSRSVLGIKVVVDSWNNIKKYQKEFGKIFLFDEDRVNGKGAWVKAFLKITKKNRWILLSATPGDTYVDYAPVLIANGYYKNRTEFNNRHIIWKPYLNYPVIDRYIRTAELDRHIKDILVPMEPPAKNKKEYHTIICNYSKDKYKVIWRERWNPWENKPIDETGTLCYLLRRVSNEDPDRICRFKELLLSHPKAIVFYNFTPELNIIRSVAKDIGYALGERNGELHTGIPKGKKWIYAVQYASGAEGWNCVETDSIIFYSLNYSYKTMTQAAGRIDRLNTKFPVLHYYYLRSKSPIDMAIVKALSQKKKFNENAFIKNGGR